MVAGFLRRRRDLSYDAADNPEVMVRSPTRVLIALVAIVCLDACAHSAEQSTSDPKTPLIGRDILFAQPEVRAPLLSPDGRYISAVRPLNGIMNYFVAPTDNPTAWHAVTHYTDRDVNPSDVSDSLVYYWTSDSRYLVFLRDHNGNEKFHVMRADIATGELRDLTPGDATRAFICQRPASYLGCEPGERKDGKILVGIYGSDARFYDLYFVDVATGARSLALKNDKFIALLADNDYEARIGIAPSDKGVAIYVRPKHGDWALYRQYGVGGPHNRAISFDPTNTKLRMFSAEDRDTQAIVEFDLDTKKTTVLAEDPQVDLDGEVVEPHTGKVQAYVRYWTKPELIALDPTIKNDLDFLQKSVDGALTILSRSSDDKIWLVKYMLSDAPETIYRYDRPTMKLTKLFTLTPKLEGLPLTKMNPVVTKSSDGFDLVSYISLPMDADPQQTGKPIHPVPIIAYIHGGPSDERAQYGFASLVQWLTNRGYGFFYMNFRGSPGFGKKFLSAQQGEWGGKMNRDVDEQVERLIADKVADPDKIAVLGGSYGGFATLVAITQRPDLYKCAIDVVGPANLETFIQNRPPEWSLESLAADLGDPRTPEGLAHLRDRSPINHVDRVKGPVLVVQGANDRRVPQAESDRMVAALKAHGVRVTYLLYPDEGHGLLRQPNNNSFDAISEVFLKNCLGGQAQPIGNALDGSSVIVPAGADYIDGLPEALAAHKAAEKPADNAAATALAVFAGSYALLNTDTIVSLEGGKLFIQVPGQDKGELVAQGGGKFAVTGSEATIAFDIGNGNSVKGLTLFTGGKSYYAARK